MKKNDYRIHVLSNLKKDVLNYNTDNKLVAEIEYTLEQLNKSGLIGFIYKKMGYAIAKDPIIKLILKKNLKSIDKENNWTALQYATYMGYYATTESLLLNGADIDFKEHSYLSPLDLACIKGHVDIVYLLLKKGATITYTTLSICRDIKLQIKSEKSDTNQKVIIELIENTHDNQPSNHYSL